MSTERIGQFPVGSVTVGSGYAFRRAARYSSYRPFKPSNSRLTVARQGASVAKWCSTALARTVGKVAVNRGDETAMDRIPATNRIVAEFEFPYLAHTPMEPLNTTIRFDGDRADSS